MQFLKQRSLPPEFVVAAEGFYGTIMMVAVLMPILYYLPGQGMPVHPVRSCHGVAGCTSKRIMIVWLLLTYRTDPFVSTGLGLLL